MQPDYLYNLAQRFANVVRSHAKRRALIFDDNFSVTYEQLDQISNQLARFLISKGVQKRDRICIGLDKTLAAYGLMLASLKLGATYFAIDVRNPATRIEKILEQCEPTLIFTEQDLGLERYRSHTILCEPKPDNTSFASQMSPSPLELHYEIDGSDPVYLMFTSGSTGVPKGAVMSHNNLLQFTSWTKWQYHFTPEDIFTNLNPLYFDNSVFDVYSSLFSGASLVPFNSATMKDPEAVITRIGHTQCSVFFSVPSLLMYLQTLKLIKKERLTSLKRIIFGGEGYPKIKLKELYAELGAQSELHNVYGPTECTCICSSYLLSEADFKNLDGYPPLGKLIPNFACHILDGDVQVPAGEAGELCLGGPCVGLGYYNQPSQTEKSFTQNPLNHSFHERIYRTGDIVRYNTADSKLYFVGRKDLQIKHQGYRIELEEIQHAISKIEGIDEAVALHSNKNNLSQIIAVVATHQSLTSVEIRKQLTESLPRYMIPDKIYILDRMPKNQNGKTDRQCLKQQYAS